MSASAVQPDAATVRAEVKAWLAENWSPDLTVREWWKRLAESGWAFPTWPVEWYGRALHADLARVVVDEIAAAGALGAPHGMGQTRAAPVILQFGTEEQKARWMPAIARGEDGWCQFFSEPNAGSDLASLQTRAVRDGDEWIVNGQKVWNSGTLQADRGILVARTDSNLPKHKGLSFFVIEVDQPGIEVRPIKQMNGDAHFNETFFSDARVSHASLLGGENNGWAVTLAVLSNERSSYAAGAGYGYGAHPGEKAGQLDMSCRQVLLEGAASVRSSQAAFPLGNSAALIELARENGKLGDPNLRQRIMKLHCFAEAAKYTTARAKAAAAAGRPPGSESSLGYVAGVRLARLTRDLGLDIVGPYGTLQGVDAPRDGAVTLMALTSLVHGIQGGAEQIQLNIIGERVLGLPKEPQVDKDIPFKDSLVGTQRR